MSLPISWEDQRAFLAVLQGGSLSAAARTLGIAQATVRARIEALEQALGTALFIRSAQGLLPTDAARSLGDHVRAMAHASDAFVREASAPRGEVVGSVRLSVSDTVGVEVLPAMLVRLCARYPGLVVEVAVSNTAANLSEQEADIAVRTVMPVQDTPAQRKAGTLSLVQRKVGPMSLGFFAHQDYLARRGVPGDLADLADHDLIGPDRGEVERRWAKELLPERVRVVMRTDNHSAMLAAARAGLGIAVVQRPVGLSDPRLVPVLPEVVVYVAPMYIVTHRNLRDVPRIRATFDHLVDEFTSFLRV